MTPAVIKGANITLTSNDPNVQDIVTLKHNGYIATAWKPDPEELAALNKGNHVLLFVLGDSHPAVMLQVAA